MIDIEIGEKYIYPGHGVVTVDDVKDRVIGGRSQRMFVFTSDVSGMNLFLPEKDIDKAGLRPVPSKSMVKKAVDSLRYPVTKQDQRTWNRRYRDYMERIEKEDPTEVAEILRELEHIKNTKDMSFGEKKLRERAISILASQLAAVIGVDHDEAESEIRSILSKKLSEADILPFTRAKRGKDAGHFDPFAMKQLADMTGLSFSGEDDDDRLFLDKIIEVDPDKINELSNNSFLLMQDEVVGAEEKGDGFIVYAALHEAGDDNETTHQIIIFAVVQRPQKVDARELKIAVDDVFNSLEDWGHNYGRIIEAKIIKHDFGNKKEKSKKTLSDLEGLHTKLKVVLKDLEKEVKKDEVDEAKIIKHNFGRKERQAQKARDEHPMQKLADAADLQWDGGQDDRLWLDDPERGMTYIDVSKMSEKEYDKMEKEIEDAEIDREHYTVYAMNDTSGYEYWKKGGEAGDYNYIMLAAQIKDPSKVDPNKLNDDFDEVYRKLSHWADDFMGESTQRQISMGEIQVPAVDVPQAPAPGVVWNDNGRYRTRYCPHYHKTEDSAYRCLKGRTRERHREISSAEKAIKNYNERKLSDQDYDNVKEAVDDYFDTALVVED